MTEPNTEVKTEKPDMHYQVEQQASVNAYFEADVDGEVVKIQLTNRYGASADKIVKTALACVEAYRALRQVYPKPTVPVPQNAIPMRDETGVAVVDGNTGKPVMTNLPEGVHLFTVAGLVHDKNKAGTMDILKVFTVEPPYHKGYGVSCFHPPSELAIFKTWLITSKENKAMYAPPESCKHVLIRDAQGEGKYPDVVEFRP